MNKITMSILLFNGCSAANYESSIDTSKQKFTMLMRVKEMLFYSFMEIQHGLFFIEK